jgi:general secretion pathway protein A
MYESFFEMSQRPFAAAPRVDRYFPGRSIEPARTAVERAIERAEGTSIVIGPAGCGKTLLLQAMAERFRGRFDVAMLSNGRLATRRALLQAILFELSMPYRGMEEGELRLALFDRLQPGVTQADGLLLLIDEAHLLPLRLLEEVRMITDFMRSGEPRVRLVLAGAAALEERLATPRLGSLQQRISTRCYLEALDRNDTAAYVRHQLVSVGSEPKSVFTDSAIETIYRATEGIPRLVNQTCDHALVMACAGGVRPIDSAGIEEAWADLQQLPTPWSQAAGYTDPNAASTDSVIEFGLLDDAMPFDPPVRATAANVAAPAPQASPALQAGDIGDAELSDEFDAIEPIANEVSASVRPNQETYASVIPVERRSEADATLDALETHLAEWETDYQPVATQQPEVELMLSEARRDPFAEDFQEEVTVVDRYAGADRLRIAPRAQVYSSEGKVLSALLSASKVLHDQARSVSSEVKSIATNIIEPTKTAPSAAGSNKLENYSESSTVVSSAPSFAQSQPQLIARTTIPLSSGRVEADFAAEADPVEPEDFVIIPKRANSDADMIIVEDDPQDAAGPTPEATPVRKQDYRQLFARMRKE